MERFRSEIVAAMNEFRIERPRFVQLLENPKCPPRLIRTLAANLATSAERFLGMLARLLALTPHLQVRATLLQNLIEEEGLEVSAGGLREIPGARHVELAWRFANAVGVPRDHASGARGMLEPWFDAALAHGAWRSAYAYLNVGAEGASPQLFAAIASALSRRGFTDSALEFFHVHAEADVTHSNRSIDMCVLIGDTPEHRAEILNAVRCGARDMWGFYN